MARTKSSAGRIEVSSIVDILNKEAGMKIAGKLSDQDYSDVKEWISTSSTWLNGITCRGQTAGIPVGRITEIAGKEGSGKSYMAAQIAANANKAGMTVIYFDSESSIDSSFLEKAGCDDSTITVPTVDVETTLSSIEKTIASGAERVVFIWDSLANTPATAELEGTFNPTETIGLKARILGKGFSKLTNSLCRSQCTLVILNQLKTNITRDPADAMINPFITPGGKALDYNASMRIFLTARKSKKSFFYDENGFQAGIEVKAKLKKSRFGTEGRECTFKILWGDEIKILDDESIFEAILGSERIKGSGAWYTLIMSDGTEKKFQKKQWPDLMSSDDKFRANAMKIFDEEVILKFEQKEGSAKQFYDVDSAIPEPTSE
tara:strand:- start:11966 stop:13096 length:1131 start_codon:yes stop_codon:yes gene_type:complete